MNRIFLYILLLTSCLVFSQPGVTFSNNTTISVLTCGVGDELYSQFGHSAIRIKDHQTGLDLVYNYGVFDFDDPNFYTNFAKGKLIYKMGYTDIANFYAQYQWENREVKEQVLNLTPMQERKLINFLQNNIKPENTKYQYDFLFNNCATKITEVLNEVLEHKVVYNRNHITTHYTFRDLINNHVPYNTWANVGINIALGSVIDVKATKEQHDFLPSYVFHSLQAAKLNKKPLVKVPKTLIKKEESRIPTSNFYTSPIFIFSILGLFTIIITFRDFRNKTRSKIFDFFILFITGTIGFFIVLLWFATDHTATANNFNLLWAFTPNIIITFSIFKNRKWHDKYFLLAFILMVVMGLVWILKIEKFAISLIPFLIALAIRYLYLNRYFKLQQELF
ncbi:lipoprotein N-acyltransferase Lnb domain-containing protein [Pseudofulvibacter geojedonensis]|uniref:DUF4105 domain-containing protein n=1 Tax=Pseudofulvibacter geojedonensis TaxID=1123758 RepID=A0ABW3HZ25_9FLAO